jgi:hypothetical protein
VVGWSSVNPEACRAGARRTQLLLVAHGVTMAEFFAAIVALGVIGGGYQYTKNRRRAARFAELELREVVARIQPTLRMLSGRWNPGDDTRLVQSGAALEVGSLAEDLMLGDRRLALRAAEALRRYNELSRGADQAKTGEARAEMRKQAQEFAWIACEALERFR